MLDWEGISLRRDSRFLNIRFCCNYFIHILLTLLLLLLFRVALTKLCIILSPISLSSVRTRVFVSWWNFRGTLWDPIVISRERDTASGWIWCNTCAWQEVQWIDILDCLWFWRICFWLIVHKAGDLVVPSDVYLLGRLCCYSFCKWKCCYIWHHTRKDSSWIALLFEIKLAVAEEWRLFAKKNSIL